MHPRVQMTNKSLFTNAKEIEKFSKEAENWWNEAGPFKALHQLNLIRLSFVKHTVCTHFGRPPQVNAPLKDLSILDVGCGGGLVTEPLHRLGATVKGIDPSLENIKIAKEHADTFLLNIPYEATPIENLSLRNTVDVIISLEVLEHLDNPKSFLKECYLRLNPGGIIILSTLNRTIRSYIEGIVSAEYILKWIPKGTHEWQKFLKPSELHRSMRHLGFTDLNFQGLSYSVLKGEWELTDTLEVNYFVTAIK